MKRSLLLAVLLVLVFGFFSQAMAYKLGSVSLQHRVYEDGRNFNRLYVEVQDDAGNFVSNPGLFKNVQLYNPSGIQIALTTKKAAIEEGLTGWYDIGVGQWQYPSSFYSPLTVSADFTTKLVPGTYRIVVTYDAHTITSYFNFTKLVALPIIKEASIKTTATAAGDLIVRWTAPTTLFTLTQKNPALSTTTRAGIWAYSGGNYLGYCQMKVGTHMQEAFFSKAFLDALRSMGGDNYTIVVTTRTNDNNNRSYSKEHVLVLP
jgi:hypothetical protein